MPKIMFRPAPTPPPFVPPTPTYDTTVYAKTNPFPTVAGYIFTINITPANVPTFDKVEIYVASEPLDQMDVLAVFNMTNADFGTEITTEAFYNSDEYPYFTIVFYEDDDEVHRANLILSQL